MKNHVTLSRLDAPEAHEFLDNDTNDLYLALIWRDLDPATRQQVYTFEVFVNGASIARNTYLTRAYTKSQATLAIEAELRSRRGWVAL
jgi:hypothetical protein